MRRARSEKIARHNSRNPAICFQSSTGVYLDTSLSGFQTARVELKCFARFPAWRRRLACLGMGLLLAGGLVIVEAAPRLTTPQQHFGFNPGDDYHLPTYRQLTNYWHKLDRESTCLKVVPIGVTEEGRPMVMAVISAPGNLRRVARYRDIARRLALAEDLSDAQARVLADQGRVIVWISGGLHATETLGSVQLVETVYQLISRQDAETRRIRENVIVLAVPANPDGMDLVGTVHARTRALPAFARQPAAALPEIHWPRQQPRFLRPDAGGKQSFEPRPVPRLVSPNRLRPPPKQSAGHRDVCPAVP